MTILETFKQLRDDIKTWATTNLRSLDAKKVDKVNGKDLSDCNFTQAEKTLLGTVQENATYTIIDNAFSTTSTNPIQNKIITEKINDIDRILNTPPILFGTVQDQCLDMSLTSELPGNPQVVGSCENNTLRLTIV